MEDRRLRIPFDKHIRADLRSVTKQVTAAGNVRFTAERTPDGHADRFWALALAIEAANTPAGQYGYRPAPRPASNVRNAPVINNYGSSEVQYEEQTDQHGNRQPVITIGQQMSAMVAQRGNPFRRTIQSEFGLKPRAIKR